MKKIILITLALLSLISCKEENSKKYTQVKVNVSNYISGLPIEDITCAVYEQDALSNSTLLSQASTFDGVFEYNFLAKKNKTYFMTCSIDLEKYKMIQFFQYVDLDKFVLNEFDFSLVPHGNMRFVFKNVNCFDENDEFFLHYFRSLDISDYITESNPAIDKKIGCSIDITTSYTPIPYGNYEYKWHVIRNGITTTQIDTMYLPVGENGQIEILY